MLRISQVLHSFTVDLPKKHGRGGQSALRFARLRMEKRHNYIRKVAETAVNLFIANDKVNVCGLILAGNADFKNDLASSDMFDARLAARIIKVVDVCYGGENGFQQAVELAADALTNVRFVREKKLIKRFFDEIAHDTGKYVFGIKETVNALTSGMIETLIVYESLEAMRVTVRTANGDESVTLLARDENLPDAEVVDRTPLIEWLINNYSAFGAAIDFVTNKSQEGSQFCAGFGGIGGILRYRAEYDVTGADDFEDGEI